MILSFGTG